jgi:fructose-1,6-bisphosphatase-3
MATYERYFIKDTETHVEKKNPYYELINDEKSLDHILQEFGLYGENSHIINGHMPVRLLKGESPIRCGGKLLIIDGGFCKAYQKQTGIAGYTLIYNSYGLTLVAHEPFSSTEEAIEKEMDIHSDPIMVQNVERRLVVGDTDVGMEMKERIRELEELLKAYRNGTIKEKVN